MKDSSILERLEFWKDQFLLRRFCVATAFSVAFSLRQVAPADFAGRTGGTERRSPLAWQAREKRTFPSRQHLGFPVEIC